jgi:uncharacterized protein (TIGR01777 family)
MIVVLWMIVVQASLGAVDNLWHHEIVERLPAKRAAAAELALHAARELLYAFVFIALAWFRWQGGLALLIAGVLTLEIVVTLADFVVEDRTRRLPASERVLHTVLALNFGAILAVLAPELYRWWESAPGVIGVSYGVLSWIFTLFAGTVLTWSVRNALAVLDLRRPPEWVRDPIAAAPSGSGRCILVTGATGFIGARLVRRLVRRGDRVIVLTRNADRALDRFGPHVHIVTGLADIDRETRIDAVVNLAGAPILGFPWTRARRAQLVGSRVEITRAVADLAARLARTPRILVSASAVGYYGVRRGEFVDEEASPSEDFQSRLCQEWEAAADGCKGLGARVVRLRVGLVLGLDGGALPHLLRPFRMGLGAVLGSGRQWVSWIHIEDLVRLIEFILDTPAARGALNAVAPTPVTHLEMQRAIGRALHRPLWLRVPAVMLRAGLGEMSQLLVDGQRAVPNRAVALGFRFRFAHLPHALADLVGRKAAPDYSPRRTPPATQVYFNGECPVCRTEMNHYAALCAQSRPHIEFIDASRHPEDFADCGLRREHLERRVYIRDGAGGILSGMPALIALWSTLPRYRLLSRFFSLPVLRQASVLLYDHLVSPTLARWAASARR